MTQPTPQSQLLPRPVQQAMPHPVPAPVPVPAPALAPAMPRPMPAPAPQILPTQVVPRPVAPPQPIHAGQGYAPHPQAMPAPHTPHMVPQPAPIATPGPTPGQYYQGMPDQRIAVAPVPVSAMAMDVSIEDRSREGGEKALPQISIHAFCDRNETANSINETNRDWRMKRTNVKIYMGGLHAAIEYYRKENTPNLILIESGMRGPELFGQLEDLASVCDAGTKVVMIGATNDIKLYRQLIEKGISDYLVPPFHPLSLIRSLSDLYADPDKPFIGRTAAFFGAKGGVGSSTLAHNIAWCMSEIVGQDTSLVDLDASWGTTGLDFAYDASQGLEEALAEPERLDETLLDRIMLRHTPKLSMLPTAGSLNSTPVMSSEAYEAVVDAVRGISPMTILDLPHYWAEWTTKVLISSDDVVVTAAPDLANLRNTKNLLDYLKTQRPNDADPILILNKTGLTKNNEITVKDFAAAVDMDPALVIGFDPDIFSEAANDGKMLTDIKGAEQTVVGLNYLAERLKTGSFPMTPKAGVSSKKVLSFLGSKSKGSANMPAGASKPSGKSIFSKFKKGK